MTTHRTQEPPAAGAIGPKPHLMTNPTGSHCNEFSKTNGVWGPWPQPAVVILLPCRSFPSVEIQEFWDYAKPHEDPPLV